MTEAERNLGTRWFTEVWNERRRESIAEMMAPECVLHEAGQDTIGPEGFYPFYERLHATFSEFRVTVHATIVEDDLQCVRWTCRARHTGNGLGIPATGKPIHVTGISILRIAGGKVVECWQNWDMLGLLEQIQEKPHSGTYMAPA